jgi:hypothetical protein
MATFRYSESCPGVVEVEMKKQGLKKVRKVR